MKANVVAPWYVAVTLAGVCMMIAAPAESQDDVRAQDGAATPQLAFDQFLASVKNDNWEAAFTVMTPDSRDFIVGSLAVIARLGIVGDEGKTIATNHVDVEKLDVIIEEIDKLPRDEQPKLAPKVAVLVEKQATLVQEVLAAFSKRKMENWMNDVKDAAEVELRKVEVNGDVATAEIRIDGAGEGTRFRKLNGRWFVDYQGR